jgi:hypothetical protein
MRTMRERSPIRRYLDGRDAVATYHPHALQKVAVSRDVLRDWRELDVNDWRAEGWEDVSDLATPIASDEEFRRVLERVLPITEVRVVDSPPDYLEVIPL